MRLIFLLLSKGVIFSNFRLEFTQKSFMRLVPLRLPAAAAATTTTTM